MRKQSISELLYLPSLPKAKDAEENVHFRKSELEWLQFTAEIDGSIQIYYVITIHGFVARNMEKKHSYKKLSLGSVPKLHVSADKKCVEFLYVLFSRQTCYCDFLKTNRRF